MSKINLNNNLYKKVVAGTMALVLIRSFGGCKKDSKEVEILSKTNLTDMYDAVKDQTIMDDYVEDRVDISWFNQENLRNFSEKN